MKKKLRKKVRVAALCNRCQKYINNDCKGDIKPTNKGKHYKTISSCNEFEAKPKKFPENPEELIR